MRDDRGGGVCFGCRLSRRYGAGRRFPAFSGELVRHREACSAGCIRQSMPGAQLSQSSRVLADLQHGADVGNCRGPGFVRSDRYSRAYPGCDSGRGEARRRRSGTLKSLNASPCHAGWSIMPGQIPGEQQTRSIYGDRQDLTRVGGGSVFDRGRSQRN